MQPHSTQGHLTLNFRRDDINAKTTMQVMAQAHPLRVIRAFAHPDGTASAHLHNVSGGVLGGDCLSLTANIGSNARVQLTTPGATRIYRHRAEFADAIQMTTLRVESGGLLEYLPESIIPFAQARYCQRTEIQLAEDAGLFWWEIVAPGRIAHQEAFAYELLEMRTDIMVNKLPIAIERLRFSPTKDQPSSIVRLGKYTYWATFYICRAGVKAQMWRDLEEQLAELGQQLSGSGHQSWGVNALVAHGLVIRGLGTESQDLIQGLIAFWRAAKRSLYREKTYLPRKLY